MTNMPCSTPAMFFPGDFVLADAQLSAQLVITAYDQFTQGVKQNYPPPANFHWMPNGPSALRYSSPLWGDAQVLTFSNFEPLGFVAWDGNGNAYISFRGTMTMADEWSRPGYYSGCGHPCAVTGGAIVRRIYPGAPTTVEGYSSLFCILDTYP